jgi:hypothetical protein
LPEADRSDRASDDPAKIKVMAVRGFMPTIPGTKLLRSSRSNVQPERTVIPIPMVKKAKTKAALPVLLLVFVMMIPQFE